MFDTFAANCERCIFLVCLKGSDLFSELIGSPFRVADMMLQRLKQYRTRLNLRTGCISIKHIREIDQILLFSSYQRTLHLSHAGLIFQRKTKIMNDRF